MIVDEFQLEDMKINKGEFHSLFRKLTFLETINILASNSNGTCRLSDFYRALKENNGIVSEFMRVRPYLLYYKLISYSLDEKFDKTIGLTVKGKILVKKIQDLFDIFSR